MNLQEQLNRIQEMMGIINESSLDDMIKNLSDDERKFLEDFGTESVLRKMMSSEEIKMANKLVKKGLIEKGTSDDKKSSVIYYIDSSIYRRL
jgi:DNA-binding MarR family transcriptional regulator